jgi:acid stress-induced BolA-like protein IbaG/YrbA
MAVHLTTVEGSITDSIRKAILDQIEDAAVEVTGSGGHFRIVVRAAVFEGKSKLQSHRLVLGAIKHLMQGDSAPVHAVDSLQTLPR